VANKRILPHVSLIKPNFSELVVILKTCLHNGLVSSGRASLENVLERVEGQSADDVDEINVRLLARALHSAMSEHGDDKKGGRCSGVTAGGTPHLLQGRHVLVSLGARGLMWTGPVPRGGSTESSYDSVSEDGVGSRMFKGRVIAASDVVNASGAGDTLLACVIHGLVAGESVHSSIERGIDAAALSVQSPSPCPANICSVI
jgi:sugar/nucleoside kinase (ribokinase family)